MNSRIIFVNSADKLHLLLNNIVLIRQEDKLTIPVEDVCALVVESSHTLFSMQLLDTLAQNNVCVFFCNEKHMPSSQVIPLHNYTRQTKAILSQSNMSQDFKDKMWTTIVKNKLVNQYQVLQLLKKDERLSVMSEYISTVENGDSTNREGLAAKQYFMSLFDNKFDRQDDNFVNACLDYAYAVLLALVARHIVANGLILPLGVHHKSEYNHYALACDFMEPVRPIFDYYTLRLVENSTDLTANFRAQLCNMVHEKVMINDKIYDVGNAIDLYVSLLCRCIISGNLTAIESANVFPRLTDVL